MGAPGRQHEARGPQTGNVRLVPLDHDAPLARRRQPTEEARGQRAWWLDRGCHPGHSATQRLSSTRGVTLMDHGPEGPPPPPVRDSGGAAARAGGRAELLPLGLPRPPHRVRGRGPLGGEGHPEARGHVKKACSLSPTGTVPSPRVPGYGWYTARRHADGASDILLKDEICRRGQGPTGLVALPRLPS